MATPPTRSHHPTMSTRERPRNFDCHGRSLRAVLTPVQRR
jgi:hypothetical protein